MKRPPRIAILMATFNGAAFLDAQLASIASQTHRDWSLTASDDGSTDATPAIIRRFAATYPNRAITLRPGPARGATPNFLSLLHSADTTEPGGEGLTALADQDDIWLPEKLARAAAALAPLADRPALYTARTMVADRSGRPLYPSPAFLRTPSFGNAIVQSIGGGNTMVLNAAALKLVRQAIAMTRAEPVAHDWWLYQVVSGADGTVLHDPRPALLYRQHGTNLVGANATARARLSRVLRGLGGQYADWNRRNLAVLDDIAPLLTDGARETLARFHVVRARRGPGAAIALSRAGIWRQTKGGNAMLAIAACLGRI